MKNKPLFRNRNFMILMFVVLIVAVMALTYSWQHQKVNHLNSVVTALNSKVSNLAHQISESQSSVSATSPVGSSVIGNTFYSCLSAGGNLSGTGPDTCTLNGVVYSFPKTFSTSFITNFYQAPPGAQTLISKLGQTNFNNCAGLTVNGVYPQAAVNVVTGTFIDIGIKDCSGGYSEYFEVKNNIWTDAGGTQNQLTCAVVDQFGITKASVFAANPATTGLNSCTNTDKTASPLPS
jgi:outer membrane murein-binding lipoprotein Lpp